MSIPGIIEIDPFFDEQDEDGHLRIYGGDKYRKGAELREVMDGHMAQMRRNGMNTVMIPRATMGGVPRGFDPHNMKDKEVNYDPHIPGQSVTLKLGQINEAAVIQASQVTHAEYPVTSLESLRLYGAATIHRIAQRPGIDVVAEDTLPARNQNMEDQQPLYVANQHTQQQAPQPLAPYQPPQPQAQYYQQPLQVQQSPQYAPPQPQGQMYKQAEYTPEPVNQQSRTVSPLASFNQPPAQPRQQPVSSGNFPTTPQSQAVPDPTIQVNFEVEGFGVFTSFYHDVLVREGFIVLAYHTKHRGNIFFPPVSTAANQPNIGMNIQGSDDTFLVATTGLQYDFQGYTLCHLMITRAGKVDHAEY